MSRTTSRDDSSREAEIALTTALFESLPNGYDLGDGFVVDHSAQFQVRMTDEEKNRRRLGAQRLKERLSRVPFYAKAAEKDGEGYWESFYASRVKS